MIGESLEDNDNIPEQKIQPKQTCLEELDSYTKINELVQKYPKIDTEWLPEKQVSQWLFAIQMPQNILEIFIQNQIDGYALLELTQSDLEDMFATNEETDSTSPNESPVFQNADLPKKVEDTVALIGKILIQISKLKIIWYKTLKKLKLLDDFREVLSEFGILT